MNCRGLAKRVMSPSSATRRVAAATSARASHAARLQRLHHWRQRPIPAARLRCGLQDDPAEPSPPRRPRCNLPARCNALRVRTTIRRASAGASRSRPAGYNDGHGAAGSRRVAGAPGQQHVRTAASRARTRSRIASWAGSGTHTGDCSPARCNLARLAASRRSVLTWIGRACAEFERRGDHDAFVPGFAQLALNAVTARAGLIAKSEGLRQP